MVGIVFQSLGNKCLEDQFPSGMTFISSPPKRSVLFAARIGKS